MMHQVLLFTSRTLLLFSLCITDTGTNSCWLVLAGEVSVIVLSQYHTGPAAPPLGPLPEHLCWAGRWIGGVFGRAGPQAAGRVFKQAAVPVGLQRGDGTGNRFLCCSAKTAAVCWMCVIEHADGSWVHTRISGWQRVCVLGVGSEGKRQHLLGETSGLGCIVPILCCMCIKAVCCMLNTSSRGASWEMRLVWSLSAFLESFNICQSRKMLQQLHEMSKWSSVQQLIIIHSYILLPGDI